MDDASDAAPVQRDIVSFDDEPLILVDSSDRVLGYRSKQAAHDGQGQLHRAFSIFLFNERGELLLQKRSDEKRLWPGFWSNSCCSHPRRGESDTQAADRRVREELGVSPTLEFLFRFEYHAQYEDAGSEHELCSIYAARCADEVRVNVHEVADTRFVTPEALDNALASDPLQYTPWLKLEWPRIRAEHWHSVERMLETGG